VRIMTPLPCEPGYVVANKYRVEKPLGSGGMATVFEATHLLLGQRVALKVLRIDPNGCNDEALARFRREARAAASISGEATARVMDVGELEDGRPFLVMEYLDGKDLERLIDPHVRIPIDRVVEYAIQACEGLAETHAAGIVHRDLKPANLFLTHASDGSLRIKLLDFGISKFAEPERDDARVTTTQELVGSPVYMSPEQMRSSGRVDRRTDIWSMGVILYELLARGRSPFHAATLPEICARVLNEKPPSLRSVAPEVPPRLERVVLRCLEKEPSRRFQTVADVAEALAPFGTEEANVRAHRIRRILHARDPRAVPAAPRRWRSRALRVGVAAAVAMAGAGLTIAWGSDPTATAAVGRAEMQASTPNTPPAVARGVALVPEVSTTPPSAAVPVAVATRDGILPAGADATIATAKGAAPLRVAEHAATPKPLRAALPATFGIPEFGGRE
jgi:Protein kinase domain